MRIARVLPVRSTSPDGSRGAETRVLVKKNPTAAAPAAFALVAAAFVVVATFCATPASAQLVASPNANVVGGPACTQALDPDCPFQVFGDISIQRQNEGSMACSSRNPL